MKKKLRENAIRLRSKAILLALRMKKFKPEEGIIILSEPRGGSTWLMEILENIPNTIINWEPLHVEYGVVPKQLNWGWYPYLPSNCKNTTHFKLIKEILSFRKSSEWTRKYVTRLKLNEFFKSEIVITKFVRGNMLVPYFVNKFKFKNKPILLIRHPIDVCISQLKVFDIEERNSIERFSSINNERFNQNHIYLQTLESKLEKKIAIWCLNNSYLLQDFEVLKKVCVIFYSDLLINPIGETRRIFEQLEGLNKSNMEKMIKSIDFRRPSKTDYKKDFFEDPKKQLNKNFRKLNKMEKDKIQLVFDHFNFKLFDAYSPYPKRNLI